ncbi:ribonuclease Y [bacterium]|nr:ribonuclease Y [bacterium]
MSAVNIPLIVVTAVSIAAAVVAWWYYGARSAQATGDLQGKIDDAEKLRAQLQKTIEAERREAQLAAKEEMIRLKAEVEKDNKSARVEIDRAKKRLEEREDAVERKKQDLDKHAQKLEDRERGLEAKEQEALDLIKERRRALEQVAHLTTQEAKDALLHEVEQEIADETTVIIGRAEREAREEGRRKASWIIGQAIQRCAVEQTTETTVSVVPLPSDEMKGRIIGREGRNIRAFEQLTGIDLIVDDTPEAVVLSGFDPVRRETARVALESLLTDGRIHPGRIEETVEKAKENVEERIKEAAEKACFETGVSGLHPEIMRLIGRLHFRTSYGQNVLNHSIEVSHLAGAMAGELGGRVGIARRAGLLHDLGKAVDFERDGSHAQIGADIASNRGEHGVVVESILAHHEEVEIKSLEAALVQAADAISASRPGARRETLEKYLKRLEELETIAHSFDGVDKVYAIQAGREVRVIVKPDKIDDLSAHKMAKGMVDRIESEMDYPGQIRVTVIRETRAVEYAK